MQNKMAKQFCLTLVRIKCFIFENADSFSSHYTRPATWLNLRMLNHEITEVRNI